MHALATPPKAEPSPLFLFVVIQKEAQLPVGGPVDQKQAADGVKDGLRSRSLDAGRPQAEKGRMPQLAFWADRVGSRRLYRNEFAMQP